MTLAPRERRALVALVVGLAAAGILNVYLGKSPSAFSVAAVNAGDSSALAQ
jgi:hypothetical protein